MVLADQEDYLLHESVSVCWEFEDLLTVGPSGPTSPIGPGGPALPCIKLHALILVETCFQDLPLPQGPLALHLHHCYPVESQIQVHAFQ